MRITIACEGGGESGDENEKLELWLRGIGFEGEFTWPMLLEVFTFSFSAIETSV